MGKRRGCVDILPHDRQQELSAIGVDARVCANKELQFWNSWDETWSRDWHLLYYYSTRCAQIDVSTVIDTLSEIPIIEISLNPLLPGSTPVKNCLPLYTLQFSQPFLIDISCSWDREQSIYSLSCIVWFRHCSSRQSAFRKIQTKFTLSWCHFSIELSHFSAKMSAEGKHLVRWKCS